MIRSVDIRPRAGLDHFGGAQVGGLMGLMGLMVDPRNRLQVYGEYRASKGGLFDPIMERLTRQNAPGAVQAMTQCPGRGGYGDLETTNLEKTRWFSDPSLDGATRVSLAYATAQQGPFRFYAFPFHGVSTRPLVCCRSSKVALNGGVDCSPFSFPIL